MSIEKKKYSLGDLAFEVKRKLPDFMDSHIQWCIRGEDFDSESLRFCRKGAVEDAGPTFFRHFLPGDFLYMTRNPRLKKGAVANFEGVAANTTLILNQKKESDLFSDDLLPYLMQSELFHDYAKSVAVGSTNLFTKWVDLKRFEFELPPVEEQNRVIEMLSKVLTAIHSTEDLIHTYPVIKASLINEVVSRCNGEFVSINHFENNDLKNGYSPKEDAKNTNYGSFSISAVRNGVLNIKPEHRKSVFVPVEIQDKYEIRKDDVFIVRGNGNQNIVGVCGRAVSDTSGYIYPDILIKVEVDKKIFIPGFFVELWNSAVVRRQINAVSQTTNGTYKVNQKSLLGVKLPAIPLSIQEEYICKIRLIEEAEEVLVEKRKHLKLMFQNLINNLIA
ncbi:TPA: restriction endonuclease subunit S [Vibrio cholerae]|nr:restriction endonuclease subunit S [Vibrio cholerae]